MRRVPVEAEKNTKNAAVHSLYSFIICENIHNLALEDKKMSQYNPETEGEVSSEVDEEITEPPMYRVLLHNDDYTSMEFVVHVLIIVFHKSYEDATRIMLNVHRSGIGVCGVFTYEVAETKVDQVHKLAEENEFPLKCTMEKE